MEENIKLIKEFRHTPEILRNGVKAYQKKYVYPAVAIKMHVFLLISAIFVCGIVMDFFKNDKLELLAYLLAVACLAFAFMTWFKPKKLRDSIVQSFIDEGNSPVYRLTVKEKEIEIAIASEIVQEKSSEESENDEYSDEIPEPSIISIDNNLSVIEEDKLFIIAYGKTVYYIIPKADFSPEELEIIRSIAK